MENNDNVIVVKTSGKAIASLIFSLVWLWGFGSLIAIVLGHMAREDIRRSNERLAGNGLALAGLIIGYSAIVLAVLGLIAIKIIPKLAH